MSLKSEKTNKIEHREVVMLHRLDIQRLSGKKTSESMAALYASVLACAWHGTSKHVLESLSILMSAHTGHKKLLRLLGDINAIIIWLRPAHS